MFSLDVFSLLFKQIEIVVNNNARIHSVSVTKSPPSFPALCSYESTMTTMEKICRAPIKRSCLLQHRALQPLSASSRWEACADKKDCLMQPLSRSPSSRFLPTTHMTQNELPPRQPRRSATYATTIVNGGMSIQIAGC